MNKTYKTNYLYFIHILLATIFIYTVSVHLLISLTAKNIPPDGADHVLILGAKLNGEEMSLSLYNRMEAAVDYLKRNSSATVIVSGGKGPKETISEAKAMARYLIEHGISKEKIMLEDKSTSTYENLLFSKKWIRPHDSVVIVSNDFHLFRAKIIAKRLGYEEVYTLPAKTPKIVLIKLWTREYMAIVKTLLFDM
jgi:uncharacterized SAM-binding protein YcdF (DUF218 family)